MQGAAGVGYAEFAISNTGPHDCTLTRPPSITVTDERGNDIGVVIAPGGSCGTPPSSSCVNAGPVKLIAGAPTPGPGSVQPGEARIALQFQTQITQVPPCTSPQIALPVLVATFVNVGELRMPFGGEVDVGPCTPQGALISWP